HASSPDQIVSTPRLVSAGAAGLGVTLQTPRSPVTQLSLSTSSPVPLVGPYSGQGQFNLASARVAAAGMQWQVRSAPAGAGLERGWLPDYESRVLQLVAYYRLADGSFVADVLVEPHAAQGIILFDSQP